VVQITEVAGIKTLLLDCDQNDLGISEMDVLKALVLGTPHKVGDKNFGKIPNLAEIKIGHRPENDPVVTRMRSLAEKINKL